MSKYKGKKLKLQSSIWLIWLALKESESLELPEKD